MADSLFDNNTPDDSNIDFLKELTGPGAKFDRTKYKSDEDLYQAIAKSNYHGDKFINMKLEEMDQMREDFMKLKADNTAQAKYEDLIKRLEARMSNPETPPGNSDNQPIDLNKIEELATQKALAAVKQLEEQKREADNLAVVESRLRERFGDNAKSIIRDKMNSLGLTAEDLKTLAKKSPDIAINALGFSSPQPMYQNPPSSNIRSDSFKPNVEIRDAVYYEKLRKENPTEYYSEKTSLQRLKDMDHPDFLKRYEQQHPSVSFY